MDARDDWELSEAVIGALIEVHGRLGPGLLESAYEACVAVELEHRGLPFERQVAIPVRYRDLAIDCAYRADIIVEGKLLLELKAAAALNEVHIAQTLTYLKLLNLELALLVNFHAVPLRRGLRRLTRAQQERSQKILLPPCLPVSLLPSLLERLHRKKPPRRKTRRMSSSNGVSTSARM